MSSPSTGARKADDISDAGDAHVPQRDEEAVTRFVERFAAELTEAGMQRTAARVFAALLASDDASMTSAELSGQLSISPAAVSGAVRYLSQVSMVGRERDPGSRRDRYRLHNELWYATFTQREPVLSRWERTLREGADTLGRNTPAGARVAETTAFFEFLQKELLSLMDRWQEERKGSTWTAAMPPMPPIPEARTPGTERGTGDGGN
ncbi:GbsR/MarR family transcriptional regulator [Streptomyces sp. NPDC051569]|uniref:GbsR/MarR family transcriptional regulator n=1 Tax=Streptomyces sp. NPDC051569 TaxID=3365661 RepID=UPI00378CCDDD